MADIAASTVMDLRQRTGLGMMECKKALTETNGDLAKAEELLRIKSGAKASKAADRVAAEGVIGLAVAACLLSAGWLGLDPRPHAAQEKPLIGVHVGAAVLAYCVIGALVLNSAAYLLQDRALARRKFGGFYSLLPALVPMDRIGSQLLGAAIWLLGLSLVIGAADWAQRPPALVGLPKLAASLITWAWCVIILVRRRRGTLSGAAFAAAALGVAVPAAIAFWLSLPSR